MESFSTFLTHFYWIDMIIVVICILGYYWLIRKNSRKILEKNTQYNAELLAMRTEIFTEYERNFFL